MLAHAQKVSPLHGTSTREQKPQALCSVLQDIVMHKLVASSVSTNSTGSDPPRAPAQLQFYTTNHSTRGVQHLAQWRNVNVQGKGMKYLKLCDPQHGPKTSVEEIKQISTFQCSS